VTAMSYEESLAIERRNRPVILFVENNECMRKTLRSVFDTLGYQVKVASRPLKALTVKKRLFRSSPSHRRYRGAL